ncbi:CVNH domain-containing protein [Trichodelitschia bisporula]|uniref:CVNH domain-containing protein n=1 Tax=Trichodelitschia bisporula TaxID=703511 RepID=A0A6G1HJI1_9PEZI|nr:CVNH domain-containing protein [Trichodelitschia bisporula]
MSNFHASAEHDSVRVDEGRYLRGQLRNGNGDLVDAEINLNDVLGNDNGYFTWGGQGFADSAENVTFSFEGDGVPILRAELRDAEGNLQYRDINLSERIGNNDGGFYFECTSCLL